MEYHGMRGTPEYRAWVNMRSRCHNPKSHIWHLYGARGITICEQWDKFSRFYADMGPRPSAAYSLDRKNNNGNYEPDNCKWSTQKEQQNNRRSNRIVTVDGTTMNIQAWAESKGLKPGTIHGRIVRGMSAEEAVRMPLQKLTDKEKMQIRLMYEYGYVPTRIALFFPIAWRAIYAMCADIKRKRPVGLRG